MAIIAPGRRPAYPPIGRLRTSSLSGGKKSGMVSLNLTPMVDMFTILVIFLIQLFSGADAPSVPEKVTIPEAIAGQKVTEAGTVVSVTKEGTILIKGEVVKDMGTDLDPGIPGLTERLREIKANDVKLKMAIAEKGGKPFDKTAAYEGELMIIADIETDFKLIRRIMYSANVASDDNTNTGWAKFKFVTIPNDMKPEGEGEKGAEKKAE